MKYLYLICAVLFLVGCKETNTDFLIGNTSFANLDSTHTIHDLETVFAKDSVVLDTTAFLIDTTTKNFNVFESGGRPLFAVSNSKKDSLKIKTIRILDGRYKTADGIGLNSTFGEIRKKYTIKKLLSTRQNVIVTLNESNLYFSISREELPSNLKYNPNINIEVANIPDAAKIKYLMMSWE